MFKFVRKHSQSNDRGPPTLAMSIAGSKYFCPPLIYIYIYICNEIHYMYVCNICINCHPGVGRYTWPQFGIQLWHIPIFSQLCEILGPQF